MGVIKNSSALRAAFYRGDYLAVVDTLGERPLPITDPRFEEKSLMQIGALTFLGAFSEAEAIFHLAEARGLGDSFLAGGRYFVSVGLLRRSKYTEARRLVSRNLLLVRRLGRRPGSKLEARTFFFCFQGAAFFHFFRGNLYRSRSLAERSYGYALEADYPPGRELALDLLGHTNCQLGSVSNGLAYFEKARDLFTEIGNGGGRAAIEVVVVKFRAQYGLRLHKSVASLRAALRNLELSDTYSRGELVLELSRQLVLRGRAGEAKELLDQSADLIYRHRHRRQSAAYNLRYSHILHLRGESHAGLALLRTARANLDPEIDRAALRQIEGLEWQISRELLPAREPEVNLRGARPVNFIDQRILRRQNLLEGIPPNSGEDILGDYIDRFSSPAPSHLPEIIRSGLLGLASRALPGSHSRAILFLGPGRGQLLVVCKGDVRFVAAGITKPMVNLLRQLHRGGVRSKESLVHQTWGYRYRAEIHDRLLHATIGKLRAALGEFSSFIEWSGGGYLLLENVNVVLNEAAGKGGFIRASGEEPLPFAVSGPSLEANSSLNHRQVRALRAMQAGEFLGVTLYARRFRVCKMTACRDLTQMVRAGLALAYGKARATTYGIREESTA